MKKLILTKAECKRNVAQRVKSPKQSRMHNMVHAPMHYYSADSLIDEILFSRVSFSKRLTLRSPKDNKLFILENCSLYKNASVARVNR